MGSVPDDGAAVDASVAVIAEELHEQGMAVLHLTEYAVNDDEVARLVTGVMRIYDAQMRRAQQRQLDLTLRANAEVLHGFYVRLGGRVDMQLCEDIDCGSTKLPRKSSTEEEVVSWMDRQELVALAKRWQPVVDKVFEHRPMRHRLEYIGCVVARPGDGDQNWHLDGVHRSMTEQERADRINVFVPLVDITEETGGTEMKRRSHVHDQGKRGAAFEGYQDLESVTHFVKAGTPVVMDYRVWHRGLANRSTKPRPLLYFKYVQDTEPATTSGAGKRPTASGADSSLPAKKPRKRIAPMQVTQ
ncbi:TPA: hypothetical protein N0F65_002562 [Lagenidium giganteum]|uniref:Phytanoyl-CoA dioxygenase n=1 Tax=Lagenidium giganteum TaxID=4803 RepID=A0AAV2YM67_9STRA|nr:TPA: hypothetical protein N0F65_002562 [Lagenidium giganteum]